MAHNALCKNLRRSKTASDFTLVCHILCAILDKPNSMTQWNVELTLGTVSVLCSQAATHPIVSTCPKAYKWLCLLVQAVIRRHRLRLEGRFHLLVAVLQCLLRTLLRHPYDASGKALATGTLGDSPLYPGWDKRAALFSRLLTLVCEPSTASVSRSHSTTAVASAGGPLDSATDAAKRSAGQHMYLVLMLYIKLQLERSVPLSVREALDPGVFSILDITTPDGRRIMNDAMDVSGRAILRELYKRYLKFGKWSGV